MDFSNGIVTKRKLKKIRIKNNRKKNNTQIKIKIIIQLMNKIKPQFKLNNLMRKKIH